MSDEHAQEPAAEGGHQDRAEQWEKDDGTGSRHDARPQDTADQWAGSGTERSGDAAEQWSGDASDGTAQDTAAQWYEEDARRPEGDAP